MDHSKSLFFSIGLSNQDKDSRDFTTKFKKLVAIFMLLSINVLIWLFWYHLPVCFELSFKPSLEVNPQKEFWHSNCNFIVQIRQHLNIVWNLFEVNHKDTWRTPLTLLWYLLILNWFHTSSWCFHCWLWTSKSWLGSPQKLTIFQILWFQLLLNWSFKLFSKTRHLLMMTGSEPIQPVFTCSKLVIETLEQRCEICSKLTKRRQWCF